MLSSQVAILRRPAASPQMTQPKTKGDSKQADHKQVSPFEQFEAEIPLEQARNNLLLYADTPHKVRLVQRVLNTLARIGYPDVTSEHIQNISIKMVEEGLTNLSNKCASFIAEFPSTYGFKLYTDAKILENASLWIKETNAFLEQGLTPLKPLVRELRSMPVPELWEDPQFSSILRNVRNLKKLVKSILPLITEFDAIRTIEDANRVIDILTQNVIPLFEELDRYTPPFNNPTLYLISKPVPYTKISVLRIANQMCEALVKCGSSEVFVAVQKRMDALPYTWGKATGSKVSFLNTLESLCVELGVCEDLQDIRSILVAFEQQKMSVADQAFYASYDTAVVDFKNTLTECQRRYPITGDATLNQTQQQKAYTVLKPFWENVKKAARPILDQKDQKIIFASPFFSVLDALFSITVVQLSLVSTEENDREKINNLNFLFSFLTAAPEKALKFIPHSLTMISSMNQWAKQLLIYFETYHGLQKYHLALEFLNGFAKLLTHAKAMFPIHEQRSQNLFFLRVEDIEILRRLFPTTCGNLKKSQTLDQLFEFISEERGRLLFEVSSKPQKGLEKSKEETRAQIKEKKQGAKIRGQRADKTKQSPTEHPKKGDSKESTASSSAEPKHKASQPGQKSKHQEPSWSEETEKFLQQVEKEAAEAKALRDAEQQQARERRAKLLEKAWLKSQEAKVPLPGAEDAKSPQPAPQNILQMAINQSPLGVRFQKACQQFVEMKKDKESLDSLSAEFSKLSSEAEQQSEHLIFALAGIENIHLSTRRGSEAISDIKFLQKKSKLLNDKLKKFETDELLDQITETNQAIKNKQVEVKANDEKVTHLIKTVLSYCGAHLTPSHIQQELLQDVEESLYFLQECVEAFKGERELIKRELKEEAEAAKTELQKEQAAYEEKKKQSGTDASDHRKFFSRIIFKGSDFKGTPLVPGENVLVLQRNGNAVHAFWTHVKNKNKICQNKINVTQDAKWLREFKQSDNISTQSFLIRTLKHLFCKSRLTKNREQLQTRVNTLHEGINHIDSTSLALEFCSATLLIGAPGKEPDVSRDIRQNFKAMGQHIRTHNLEWFATLALPPPEESKAAPVVTESSSLQQAPQGTSAFFHEPKAVTVVVPQAGEPRQDTATVVAASPAS